MNEHPVIICGLGEIGSLVLEYVRLIGWPVVVVDDAASPDDPRLQGVPLVRGDCRRRETLEKAGIAQARGVLVLTSNDLVNVATTLTARSVRPNLRVVLRLFNQNLKKGLGRALPGVTALSKSALTAPLLALTALTGDALGTLQLSSGQRQMTELRIKPHSPLCGRVLSQVLEEFPVVALLHRRATPDDSGLKAGSRVSMLARGTLAIDRPYVSTHAVLETCSELGVDTSAVLEAGDRLVISGTANEIAPLEALSQGVEPDALEWAGAIRRWLRLTWRTLRGVDKAVKWTTGILVTVVLIGTLIFHWGMDLSLGKSLLWTIGIMATSAEMHEKELVEEWSRTFASILRMIGITVTAAYTAILTRFLLNARFGDLFATRRMPDKGHVVICGLGTVGFRVLEELLKIGQQVVVIERTETGRFVAAAKRLGAIVQIGDGTLEETLQQARVDKARAFIAATSEDLANIEMALQVRHLHPSQRVVVRLDDPHLADTLRAATRIRYTMALPALAAPAFVAALLYEGEMSLFWLDGQLVAAIELVVRWRDPVLEGHTVATVASEYHFIPLEVIADGKPVPRKEQEHYRLKQGDRLQVVASLVDLEQLLRAERPTTDFAVEVESWPEPKQEWLQQLFRQHRPKEAAASQTLPQPPFWLAENLTYPQAEELLEHLKNQEIQAQIVEDFNP
jgi:Trk K+ transport system NAD-binding subunit